jgi:hypothetical protein
MQKKQLSVLVLIILCFLLGCNRETPKDESQQNYEDESNISKTNGEELVNINSELLGSTLLISKSIKQHCRLEKKQKQKLQ